MSDELDEERAAREATTPAPDPAAMQTALGAAAGTAEARSYLTGQQKLSEKQTRLVDLQIENLEKLDEYEVSHLRWRRFNDQMRGALQAIVVIALLIVLAGFGGMVWSAVNANGLVIEAFSVPPDLAAKGLTGDVVATKMLARLSVMQAQTESVRAASSYVNNWGDDIKVQIPDTGISIGELNRYLRGWLGHETHITGAVYRAPTGIAVTAQAGGEASPVFTGEESDLDNLIQKAAEAVYGTTQPYRFAVYLDQHRRKAEADAAYANLVAKGSIIDRAYAYSAIGNDLPIDSGDFAKARRMLREALAVDPNLLIASDTLVQTDLLQQHDEQALRDAKHAVANEERDRDPTIAPAYAEYFSAQRHSWLIEMQGDFEAAIRITALIESRPDIDYSAEDARNSTIRFCGRLHDARCFDDAWDGLPPAPNSRFETYRAGSRQIADIGLGHWRDAVSNEAWIAPRLAKAPAIGQIFLVRGELPVTALAHAELGDFKTAHAEIDRTPVDCDICLRNRGTIDSLEQDWGGAQYWFRRATASAPSVPFAYADWGAALLSKGDLDGAISEFKLANDKGPHFADPLEMWGEALIRENRSDLALAKFAEADKYAPNWGRLHLKWGEALVWSGKPGEAKKQFDIAVSLDLSSDEKSEIARMRSMHG